MENEIQLTTHNYGNHVSISLADHFRKKDDKTLRLEIANTYTDLFVYAETVKQM